MHRRQCGYKTFLTFVLLIFAHIHARATYLCYFPPLSYFRTTSPCHEPIRLVGQVS